MKKSLLCLIVAMLMLLPVLLTSCGDDMTAEDIANAVVFLASDEAGYITGQTIHVNGGMAMI